ncbi:hypothetical protein QBC35DRAFT_10812 [Podospora australis]|uniref:PH domain-containing protein n=1 Tax=Podospora australis TaxID=1536484 RepID=A0AAN7AP63_9PEZI|nr:hypothetical protein QBC35DRAFT_10812 [Podospora australis]
MAEVQTQLATMSLSAKPEECRRVNVEMPPTSITIPPAPTASRLISRLTGDTYSPVNQNGSFEFDRVIKSGYVQKRARKTKTWRTVYIVLRPSTLSIYKSDKEEKLRHKLHLSDLTAVAMLKDPKNKRLNVFGLFSPSKNYHLQASTLKDAQEWVDLIRKGARIEEEEEEMFLASPAVRRSNTFLISSPPPQQTDPRGASAALDRLASSSPEPLEPPPRTFGTRHGRRHSQLESSGMSGTELASHSDFSDCDVQRVQGASFESLGVHSPPATSPGLNKSAAAAMSTLNAQGGQPVPSTSQMSGINIEQDPDRIIWQGWMSFLRSKGGVKQWKKSWAVLRPRNFKLYKDDSESSVLFIAYLSSIVNVVDIDPMSRTKKHCLQIITDEKSYKFCAQDEEALVQCLGAFKSLLAKRRELEAKAVATATTTAAPGPPPPEIRTPAPA